mmetsp:Transcript_168705/g.542145  ORF Transcript_168705/g.542145 Transcript_168705/m.542145 type:complete len:137 (+) Transcript_168705:274-684(+)
MLSELCIGVLPKVLAEDLRLPELLPSLRTLLGASGWIRAAGSKPEELLELLASLRVLPNDDIRPEELPRMSERDDLRSKARAATPPPTSLGSDWVAPPPPPTPRPPLPLSPLPWLRVCRTGGRTAGPSKLDKPLMQ